MSITDKKPVPPKICPVCGGSFPARGIHTHIKMAHGAAKAEAWRVANRIEVNKKLEKRYAGSTGEVVRALVDPGSVLSKTLDAPGSPRSGPVIRRALEMGKLKKELKPLRTKTLSLSGETCADVAYDEASAAEKVITKELKEKAPPPDARSAPGNFWPIDWFRGKSDAPSAPAKAASLGKAEKGAAKQAGLDEDAKEPVKKKKWFII